MPVTTDPNEQLASLRKLLDAVPDLLFLCRYDDIDAEGRIIECNAIAREVCGLAMEEMVGMTPRSLMTPDNDAAERPDMRRAVFQRAREIGKVEVPNTIRLPRIDGSPRLRIRIVWLDPNDTLVLFQVELVRD